ncbi:MAG: hypothetical protein JWM09_1383 [Francisellaceae bacterium]|nr:hypothetical protein [Francisellaceae bacterium]
MLERSEEIASNEMQEVNKRLEEAQELAHLGTWTYNPELSLLSWSSEIFRITGMDPKKGSPNLSEYTQVIHPHDREKTMNNVNKAINYGVNYESEIRFIKNEQIRWVKIIAKTNKTNNEQKQYILSGTMLDITDKKIAELRQALEHEIMRLLIDSAVSPDSMTSILKAIGENLEWEGVIYWSQDKETSHPIALHHWINATSPIQDIIHELMQPSMALEFQRYFSSNNWLAQELERKMM